MPKEEPTPRPILRIVDSLRRRGNTEILVESVLTGADEAGGLTEKFILNNLDVSSCQVCNNCLKVSKFVQQDNMFII